jgi:undecaprenyl-phosphate galactose phosphotransferase/putative colanic acid biosynthesis UDP-glucose lipid carrier transferase
MVILNASYLISLLMRFGNLNGLEKDEVKTVFLLSNGLWIFLVLYYDAFKIIRVERIEALLNKTFRLIFIHASIIAGFVVILKYGEISRLRMLYFYLFFFLLVFFSRVLFLKILKIARSKGFNYRNVLIVGANETGNRMAEILSKDLSYGFQIMGFVDDRPEEGLELKAPHLGNLKEVESIINHLKIDELYIALHIDSANEITRLIEISERYMVRIKFIPDFQQYTKTRKVIIDFYENTPVLMLRKEPLELPVNRLIKKLFDVLFSLLVIVLIFSWLFPILIIAIKMSSKGPIFFRQQRSGEDNEAFTCLKFRTMRVNTLADELQATANDPRITRLGAFMRKTNLDELPQFFNVLWGNMSVVGPRPHMLKHTEQYSELIHNYLVRHFAKPGITGWAQVNGFRGETKELVAMKKRVEFDIWYIENWSFLLDLKIIWRTTKNMLKGEKNAY